MNDPASDVSNPERPARKPVDYVIWVILAGLVWFLFVIGLGPIHVGLVWPERSHEVQTSRTIALAMFQYATDHDLNYPDGKSSTEVFQKLMDENYVSDPTLFFIPMPGKVKPVAGQKLRAENVSRDVTSSLDRSSSDFIPVVFMTGYRVHYVAGGAAEPLIQPFPQFGHQKRPPNWFERLIGREPEIIYDDSGGVAVTYKSNMATFRPAGNSPETKFVIPDFISKDFVPDGKTHLQLTPDAALP